jgi:hypothetical protein
MVRGNDELSSCNRTDQTMTCSLPGDICSKPLHFLQARVTAKPNWSSLHCRNSDSQIRQSCELTMLNISNEDFRGHCALVIAAPTYKRALQRYAICNMLCRNDMEFQRSTCRPCPRCEITCVDLGCVSEDESLLHRWRL